MAGTDGPDERPRGELGQVDPLLQEDPVRRWTIWALAVAIALVVGVVFYVVMSPSWNSPSAGGSTATSRPAHPAATTGSGSGQMGR